jgi:hypothetical protein
MSLKKLLWDIGFWEEAKSKPHKIVWKKVSIWLNKQDNDVQVWIWNWRIGGRKLLFLFLSKNDLKIK